MSNIKEQIVVLGAGGTQGGAVAERLLAEAVLSVQLCGQRPRRSNCGSVELMQLREICRIFTV